MKGGNPRRLPPSRAADGKNARIGSMDSMDESRLMHLLELDLEYAQRMIVTGQLRLLLR
jgi:hypothetical protein